MRMISRKQTESIQIGDNIVVTVLSIRGCNVRLGIAAPRRVPVHRNEVHQAIAGLRDLASGAPPSPAASITAPVAMPNRPAGARPGVSQTPATADTPLGARFCNTKGRLS